MYLALRKCKDDRKILTIILIPDFCPLKPKIARFSIGFRLLRRGRADGVTQKRSGRGDTKTCNFFFKYICVQHIAYTFW